MNTLSTTEGRIQAVNTLKERILSKMLLEDLSYEREYDLLDAVVTGHAYTLSSASIELSGEDVDELVTKYLKIKES